MSNNTALFGKENNHPSVIFDNGMKQGRILDFNEGGGGATY